MKKLFLLDTSVLMRNSKCFYVFDDNDVSISITTLEELDGLKDAPGERGYCAREAIREILNIKKNNNKLPGGGSFLVSDNACDIDVVGWDRKKNDNIIIFTAKQTGAILITADASMLVKAESVGVTAEIYYNEQASEESLKYAGYREIYLPETVIKKFYADKTVEYSNPELHINEFLIIKNELTGESAGLGRYDGRCILPLRYQEIYPCGVKPRNVMQKFAMEALLAPADEIPLVILKGPAGTAKTFLSIACGLHQTMETEEYRKVLALRPASGFDMTLGYMPGTEEEKAGKYARPVLDNLESLMSSKGESIDETSGKIDFILDKGYIKIESLEFMRGRSIPNSFIFIDEAQNATPRQMLGILTRSASGAKIVVCGDPDQIDNPKLDSKNNGLTFAAARMLGPDLHGEPLCAQLTFSEDNCIRSPLSRRASELLKG